MAKVKFRLSRVLLVLFCMSFCFSQVPSQHDQLRIAVWAELDAFPGLFGDENGYESLSEDPLADGTSKEQKDGSSLTKLDLFDTAVARTKQIAPFLLNGMINGWTFDYTPKDNLRGVSEFFELIPVRDFDEGINPITYHSPEPVDGKLYSWAYCSRTETQQISYERWFSITNPKVHGTGQGPVYAGMEGIRQAVAQAARNAIHEYWRRKIKNKPKEIMGKLLLVGDPRIYIKDGRYTVDLDFFMQTDKMVEYTQY